MKRIITLFLFILLVIASSTTSASQINCTVEIASDIIFIDGSTTTINPGDVVCLLAGNKDYLLLKDIQGTESQPITIINKGGAVIINTDHSYGIKFDNCKHVIFSGSGEDGLQYGVQVQRVGQGAGMSIDNRSTNVEIESVEIAYTLFGGIYAKTEPYQGDCNNLVTRENFTMYNLSIHDCYLHDIADEGMYIGSSKYTGQTIAQCDNIVVLPHIIEGVSIYNNIVENTGWDGIQVSSAPVNCNVFDNLIRYDSYEEEPYQMSGILIGGGAKCDCYNNKIFDGKGDGIDVFGLGYMKIFNNLIVRAGRTFKPDEPTEYKHGIYIGEVVNSPGATFEVYNNSIISPKSSGVKYSNQDAAMGYIKNNIITNPGLDPEYIIIDNGVSQTKVEISHNFNVPTNSMVNFMNESDNNFDLKPNSDAINYGTSLTTQGITFDIDNRFRPFHTYFDAGAYECHDPYAGISENGKDLIGNLYPMPAVNYINIPFNSDVNKEIQIALVSITGKVVYTNTYNKNNITTGKITINLVHIPTGKYITRITIGNRSFNRPVIIIK